MAITNLYNDLVLDVYDHDQTQSTIKAIALDDNSRYVRAQLTYDEAPYTAPQNAAVTLTVIRPDKVGVAITGSTFSYDINVGGEYDPESGEEITPSTDETYYGVTAELDQVALAKAGVCLAQFKIVDGTQTLRTEIFKINNGRALDADTDEWAGSIDGYNLDELVRKVDAIGLGAIREENGTLAITSTGESADEYHTYVDTQIAGLPTISVVNTGIHITIPGGGA